MLVACASVVSANHNLRIAVAGDEQMRSPTLTGVPDGPGSLLRFFHQPLIHTRVPVGNF